MSEDCDSFCYHHGDDGGDNDDDGDDADDDGDDDHDGDDYDGVMAMTTVMIA